MSQPTTDRGDDRCHRRPRLFLAAVCSVAFIVPLPAQDTDPVSPLTLGEQETVEPDDTLTHLEQPSTDLPALARRIVTDMQDAEARLANGELNPQTGDLQNRINADLQRLLEALEQQAAPASPIPADESPQQAMADSSSAAGGTGSQRQPDASAAGESTEGDSPGTLTEADLQHRRNLATSVWGHLPARERDEMLGAFSERFLPAYDELVRQYYESLATRKARER